MHTHTHTTFLAKFGEREKPKNPQKIACKHALDPTPETRQTAGGGGWPWVVGGVEWGLLRVLVLRENIWLHKAPLSCGRGSPSALKLRKLLQNLPSCLPGSSSNWWYRKTERILIYGFILEKRSSPSHQNTKKEKRERAAKTPAEEENKSEKWSSSTEEKYNLIF